MQEIQTSPWPYHHCYCRSSFPSLRSGRMTALHLGLLSVQVQVPGLRKRTMPSPLPPVSLGASAPLVLCTLAVTHEPRALAFPIDPSNSNAGCRSVVSYSLPAVKFHSPSPLLFRSLNKDKHTSENTTPSPRLLWGPIRAVIRSSCYYYCLLILLEL